MKEWLKVSCLLCVFGLLREIRPNEPYGFEFLVGEWRNITAEQVYRDALPVGTYSYLAQLVVIFLITDYFRYKPLIILSGICGIIVSSMFIWTKSLLELQILEVIYGTFLATEVAYYTYIYAKVDKKYYPKVTSHTRAAFLIGKLIAGISSQVLIYFKWMNYLELNYITLVTQIAATTWAIFLPNVKTTVYFHRNQEYENDCVKTAMEENDLDKYGGIGSNGEIGSNGGIESNGGIGSNGSIKRIVSTEKEPISNPLILLKTHFKNAYTNPYVIQWSIWYSVALCGYLQVMSFIQTLWKSIDENPVIVWNGTVDAVLTFMGAVGALLAGYLHAGRLNHRSSILMLCFLSVIEGCAVLAATLPRNLIFAYAGYTVFGAIYTFSITVASAEVAKHLEEDSFALVFGVNTFIALVLQTILTVLVVDGNVILLDIFGQFIIYAGWFIATGILFAVFILFNSIMK